MLTELTWLDKGKGHLGQFPNDVDWIRTLNSKDVRIME